MKTPDRELLRRLPKAELHCHLDGSLRPETMIELAAEHGVTLPRARPDQLREYMLVKDARNLEDYLARFSVTLSVMQWAGALERVAFELAEDARLDGVIYLEARFCPVLNVEKGLQLQDVVEAVLRGFERAQKEYDIVCRVIICALRNLAPEVSLSLAELAVAYKDRGVVGFDLAGAESGNPASRHAGAFLFARSNDMACTCHAGEGDGPGSIREAIHVCGAHRIGHGTRLFEDPSLLQYANDRRIPIEICVTSNVQTHAVNSYETHPLRRYFNAGLPVVLNTDNRLMSGTTLTDEYFHAARYLGFSLDELATIALNGFECAFIHYRERQSLLDRARARLAATRSSAK